MAINLSLFRNAKAEECESLKIQFYENLKMLQNCTVIFGNLDLMFTDEENFSAEEVNGQVFPLRWFDLKKS